MTRGWQRIIWVAAVSALVAVLTFARASGLPFVGDDLDIIVGNPAVTSPTSWADPVEVPYWNIPHGKDMGLWRPATTGAFALVWSGSGGEPGVFHLLNIALHGLNSALVAVLATVLFGTGLGWVTGLLFAVHPVHVEAVANVVGLAELLSAAAVLLACLWFWRSGRALGPGGVLGICSLFALAVLAKESGATLPLALLLLHQFRSDTTRASWRQDLGGATPLGLGLLATLAVVLLIRTRVLGALQGPIPPVGADLLDTIPRIWTVAATWLEAVRLLMVPVGYSLDYSPGRIPIRLMWDGPALSGLALVLGGLAVALWGWRRSGWSRAAAFGVVWLTFTALPTSNLPVLTGVLLAERTLYLPSVGFVLAAGAVLTGLHRRRPRGRAVRIAVGVGGIAALAALSWQRIPLWESNERYWTEVAARSPQNGRGHQHRARRLWALGERRAALEAYSRALGLLGGDHLLAAEVSERLFEQQSFRGAEVLARLAWDKAPDYATGPALLALALLGQGRDQEALSAARAAVLAEPEGAQARALLEGVEQAVAGRHDADNP